MFPAKRRGSRGKAHVSTQDVRNMVERIAKKALDNKEKASRLTPHVLRHYFATSWYKKGLKKTEICRLMN